MGLTTAVTETITSLLDLMRAGDKPAADKLFQCVYDELRVIARAALRGSGVAKRVEGTALVNAACERLLRREQLQAENRAHFFFILSRAMRDVLIDEARANQAIKRGGNCDRVVFADIELPDASRTIEFLDLHEAIEELRQVDENCAAVVSLRFFGGRTLEEAADCMGCTVAMARRHWTYARAWLHKRLSK